MTIRCACVLAICFSSIMARADKVEDAAKLRDQAEQHLTDGDTAAGIKLLLESLDSDPTSIPAIEDLHSAALLWPDMIEELLKRVDAAVAHADEPLKSKLRWRQLAYAVLFDKYDRITKMLKSASDYYGTDTQKRASVGGLLIQLGRETEAEQLLKSTDHPLARFYLAQLAQRRREAASAKTIYATMTDSATARLLARIGEAMIDLKTPRGIKAARLVGDTPAETVKRDGISPLAYSQLLLLRMQIAREENRSANAEAIGAEFADTPQLHDLGAMVRAKVIVGPLWKCRH